ncbi:MAG: hypothetical protein ACFFG0_52285 [Candidatus Thorarchaeota archaeon]
MPSVIFSHTKTKEKKYLEQLLKEKEWFRRKKFSVFLPSSRTDIKQEILRKNELLKQKITQLQKTWRKIEKNYFDIVRTFHYKKLLPKYICHISYFGPEGKYCRPNLLFVRLRTKLDEKRVIETIGHELLHLLFADFFETKKLNYSEREGMVDALILQSDLSSLFPQYQKQSIGKLRPKLLKSILM